MGPPKKRKAASSGKLAQLCEELELQPRENANHVPKLISSLAPNAPEVLPVIQGLTIYFVGCFEREELVAAPPAGSTDPRAVYAAWLSRQLAAAVSALLALVSGGAEARVQVAALAAVMELCRGRRAGEFDNQLFAKAAATALTAARAAPEVLGALLERYAPHADVHYHLARTVAKLCARRAARPAPAAAEDPDDAEEEADGANGAEPHAELSPDDFARTLYDLLSRLPPAGEEAEEEAASWCGAAEVGAVAPAADASNPRQRKKARREGALIPAAPLSAKWASPKLRRRALSDAWLAFLRLELPTDVYRKVLGRLHDLIIPALASPLLLSDYLTHSLDRGGLDGMLALNGIFLLVTRHGLEYPAFYERLYGLLRGDAFRARHRRRFFELADIFLASPMVPAYTAAAFAKRFARLALAAPPAGALLAVVFIHNLLRRHPACLQLLHRAGPPKGEVAGGVWAGEDVYDDTEPDPAKARALESSLWELAALRRHADPSVASYCAVLDKDLGDRRRTAEIDVGDVLAASYASMFERENGRRLKAVPAAFYATPPAGVVEVGRDDFFEAWGR